MEEVLAAHKDVSECAVIGVADEVKGEVPCGFIVLKAGVNRPPDDIERECVVLVREKIGPVAPLSSPSRSGGRPRRDQARSCAGP